MAQNEAVVEEGQPASVTVIGPSDVTCEADVAVDVGAGDVDGHRRHVGGGDREAVGRGVEGTGPHVFDWLT